MLCTVPLLSSAWFSGFVDAGGHFSVTASTAKHTRVRCSFELIQSRRAEEALPFMIDIGTALGATVCVTSRGQYRLRTSTVLQNHSMLCYLLKFPLYSSKYFDFLCWAQVVKIFELQEHKTPLGVEKIYAIKAEMSGRRTHFV